MPVLHCTRSAPAFYLKLSFAWFTTTLLLVTALAPLRAEEMVSVEKNRMIRMRDGVHLATDIVLPTDATSPLPCILIRTPYNKDGSTELGKFFSAQHYAVVIQDVRGRYHSNGTFYIYTNEGPDGFDTVSWIAQQPWSNGKVGTYGGSYLAATQNALAVLNPPALKTMFVLVGTSNYIEDGAGRGGAFALLHNMTYAFRLAMLGHESASNPVIKTALTEAYDKLPEWLWYAPLNSHSPLRHTPSYNRWYSDWRNHPTYDRYWKQNGYNFEEFHPSFPSIPIYFVGGWYDLFKRGTLMNFQRLATRSAETKLVMGPWTHSTGVTYAGDVDFGKTAAMNLRDEAMQWFDHTLKKTNPNIQSKPPVRYFQMEGTTTAKNSDGRLQSGGQWASSSQWPPENLASMQWYLHDDGSLERTRCKCQHFDLFSFTPEHPVPTIGGNIDSGRHIIPRGPQNQIPQKDHFAASSTLPLSARHDVLVFETAPLATDVDVVGPIHVKLWVSSTATDTDFTAKLIDVFPPSEDYPNGYSMNVEDGILRMRFRNSREKEELMVPGTIYPITIDLWATANRFSPGHRIRVDISSSNFPMYDINPNTGEPLGKHSHSVPALNRVYHDREHPSHLHLSVRTPLSEKR